MLLIVDFGLPISDCGLPVEARLHGTDGTDGPAAVALMEIRFFLTKRTEVAKWLQKWCGKAQIVRLCPRLSLFVALCPLKQGTTPLCEPPAFARLFWAGTIVLARRRFGDKGGVAK